MTTHLGRARFSLIEALSRLPSIEVRRSHRVCALQQPLSVALVGGMCAGKSTLAHAAVEDPSLSGCCEVVPRCSTRAPRQGDGADGITSVSWEQFHARRAAGSFALSWERPLANDSSIGYGCLMPSEDSVPIFMAGHGIYTNKKTVHPVGALEHAMIIGVMAPADVRAERLRLRSPDIVARGSEADVLLEHDDDAMAANVDILVHNYGAHQATAINDFVCALVLVLTTVGYKPSGKPQGL